MIKDLILKFDYGWRMRGLWLVLHVISIYSAFMAPQYIGWALLFAVMATAVGGYAGWHRLWAHKSYKTDNFIVFQKTRIMTIRNPQQKLLMFSTI